MLTRFLVSDDPKVSVVVRDADSRLSPRELFAVNAWISSDFRFHVMRDHASHDVAVLGGMFGMKRGALRDAGCAMSQLITRALIENPTHIRGVRGEDQAFLTRYVWPKVKHSCFAHDVNARRCSKFGSERCRDFPMGAARRTGEILRRCGVQERESRSLICAFVRMRDNVRHRWINYLTRRTKHSDGLV